LRAIHFKAEKLPTTAILRHFSNKKSSALTQVDENLKIFNNIDLTREVK
jgi:hypothetical protein